MDNVSKLKSMLDSLKVLTDEVQDGTQSLDLSILNLCNPDKTLSHECQYVNDPSRCPKLSAPCAECDYLKGVKKPLADCEYAPNGIRKKDRKSGDEVIFCPPEGWDGGNGNKLGTDEELCPYIAMCQIHKCPHVIAGKQCPAVNGCPYKACDHINECPFVKDGKKCPGDDNKHCPKNDCPEDCPFYFPGVTKANCKHVNEDKQPCVLPDKSVNNCPYIVDEDDEDDDSNCAIIEFADDCVEFDKVEYSLNVKPGQILRQGDLIGHVMRGGKMQEIHSPFDGGEVLKDKNTGGFKHIYETYPATRHILIKNFGVGTDRDVDINELQDLTDKFVESNDLKQLIMDNALYSLLPFVLSRRHKDNYAIVNDKWIADETEENGGHWTKKKVEFNWCDGQEIWEGWINYVDRFFDIGNLYPSVEEGSPFDFNIKCRKKDFKRRRRRKKKIKEIQKKIKAAIEAMNKTSQINDLGKALCDKGEKLFTGKHVFGQPEETLGIISCYRQVYDYRFSPVPYNFGGNYDPSTTYKDGKETLWDVNESDDEDEKELVKAPSNGNRDYAHWQMLDFCKADASYNDCKNLVPLYYFDILANIKRMSAYTYDQTTIDIDGVENMAINGVEITTENIPAQTEKKTVSNPKADEYFELISSIILNRINREEYTVQDFINQLNKENHYTDENDNDKELVPCKKNESLFGKLEEYFKGKKPTYNDVRDYLSNSEEDNNDMSELMDMGPEIDSNGVYVPDPEYAPNLAKEQEDNLNAIINESDDFTKDNSQKSIDDYLKKLEDDTDKSFKKITDAANEKLKKVSEKYEKQKNDVNDNDDESEDAKEPAGAATLNAIGRICNLYMFFVQNRDKFKDKLSKVEYVTDNKGKQKTKVVQEYDPNLKKNVNVTYYLEKITMVDALTGKNKVIEQWVKPTDSLQSFNPNNNETLGEMIDKSNETMKDNKVSSNVKVTIDTAKKTNIQDVYDKYVGATYKHNKDVNVIFMDSGRDAYEMCVIESVYLENFWNECFAMYESSLNLGDLLDNLNDIAHRFDGYVDFPTPTTLTIEKKKYDWYLFENTDAFNKKYAPPHDDMLDNECPDANAPIPDAEAIDLSEDPEYEPQFQLGPTDVPYWYKWFALMTVTNIPFFATGLIIFGFPIPLPAVFICIYPIYIKALDLVMVIGLSIRGLCFLPVVLFCNIGSQDLSALTPLVLALKKVKKIFTNKMNNLEIKLGNLALAEFGNLERDNKRLREENKLIDSQCEQIESLSFTGLESINYIQDATNRGINPCQKILNTTLLENEFKERE